MNRFGAFECQKFGAQPAHARWRNDDSPNGEAIVHFLAAIAMDFETLVAALTPVRLTILDLLIAEGPMSMGALSDALGLSPSSMTEHVNSLLTAGLAHSRREGRSVIVASRIRGVELVIDWCD